MASKSAAPARGRNKATRVARSSRRAPVGKRSTATARKAVAGARAPRAKAAKTVRRAKTQVRRAPGAVASGAPEIMVTLNSEHRYIASLLDALAEQADRLLPGRTPDYAMMLDIARYMTEYPDEFHHPREDLLFDRLAARDPDSRTLIGQLLEGHKEIFRRSRELLAELRRATAADGGSVDNRRLKYLCDRYIGYYWDHINTEEGKLFPRATAKLRPDDWYAVNSGAKYVDDPLFGTRVRKEYRRLSQYLSSRVERATEEIAVAELFGIEALIESIATLGEALGEIRGILGRRLRASARESLGASEDRLAQRSVRAAAGLPVTVLRTVATHTGGAAREIVAVLGRSRSELAEPFAARFAYLRKMLD